MPDPLLHVGTISSIGPTVLDRDKVESTVVTFDDGAVMRVLSSPPGAEGLLSALQDLLDHRMLVYAEIAADGSSISRVLAPEIGFVRSLETSSEGDTLVEMEVAACVAVLRRSHRDYQPFLGLLETSRAGKTPVAITVAPIDRDVLDVRAAPHELSGAAEPSPAEPPDLREAAVDPCRAIAPVSSDRAVKAFAGIMTHQCDSKVSPPDCIPFRYVDSYCQVRAHMIAQLLKAADIQSCKVWAYGPLGAHTASHPGCYVRWDLRHVAPVVRVGNGLDSQLMAFDPSLFEDAPVPLATWLRGFDPEPFETRCTSSLVLDQPHSAGPKFDSTLSRTKEGLVLARTALRDQIRRYGAPPYAKCAAPGPEPIPAEDMADAGEITRLLARVRDGDLNAREILCEKVYAELHRLASAHVRRERPGHLLQPTMLVHDAYLKLVRQDMTYNDRRHFFAVASGMMRRLLVDHARAAKAEKRGGGAAQAPFDERVEGLGVSLEDILSIDEALEKLRALDERQVRIVEMKVFAGLSEEDIADVLQVSSRTVKRHWRVAKIWLAQQLRPQ